MGNRLSVRRNSCLNQHLCAQHGTGNSTAPSKHKSGRKKRFHSQSLKACLRSCHTGTDNTLVNTEQAAKILSNIGGIEDQKTGKIKNTRDDHKFMEFCDSDDQSQREECSSRFPKFTDTEGFISDPDWNSGGFQENFGSVESKQGGGAACNLPQSTKTSELVGHVVGIRSPNNLPSSLNSKCTSGTFNCGINSGNSASSFSATSRAFNCGINFGNSETEAYPMMTSLAASRNTTSIALQSLSNSGADFIGANYIAPSHPNIADDIDSTGFPKTNRLTTSMQGNCNESNDSDCRRLFSMDDLNSDIQTVNSDKTEFGLSLSPKRTASEDLRSSRGSYVEDKTASPVIPKEKEPIQYASGYFVGGESNEAGKYKVQIIRCNTDGCNIETTYAVDKAKQITGEVKHGETTEAEILCLGMAEQHSDCLSSNAANNSKQDSAEPQIVYINSVISIGDHGYITDISSTTELPNDSKSASERAKNTDVEGSTFTVECALNDDSADQFSNCIDEHYSEPNDEQNYCDEHSDEGVGNYNRCNMNTGSDCMDAVVQREASKTSAMSNCNMHANQIDMDPSTSSAVGFQRDWSGEDMSPNIFMEPTRMFQTWITDILASCTAPSETGSALTEMLVSENLNEYMHGSMSHNVPSDNIHSSSNDAIGKLVDSTLSTPHAVKELSGINCLSSMEEGATCGKGCREPLKFVPDEDPTGYLANVAR